MRLSKRTYCWLAVGCAAIVVCFVLAVRAAGLTRQARFNVDMTQRVLVEFYRQKGRYPKNLSELPNYNVISVRDNLYVDGKLLRQGTFRGYNYFLSPNPSREGFVLSASPSGLFKGTAEFAITEDGNLKENEKRVDAREDSFEEITAWKTIPRIERIKVD